MAKYLSSVNKECHSVTLDWWRTTMVI